MNVEYLDLPESAFRPLLPAVPDGFHERLASIATRDDKPMFRLVDGTRETHVRCEKEVLKHLLMLEGQQTFIKHHRTWYRRQNFRTRQFFASQNIEEVRALKSTEYAPHIDITRLNETVGIGRPCWIVEVLITADEHDVLGWEAARWDVMNIKGIDRRVDVLGPFPREGRYIACFDVVGKNGIALSPNDNTIAECRRRWQIATGDTATTTEAIQASEFALAAFERKQLELWNENFKQFHGIVARNAIRNAEMGRPIRQELN